MAVILRDLSASQIFGSLCPRGGGTSYKNMCSRGRQKTPSNKYNILFLFSCLFIETLRLRGVVEICFDSSFENLKRKGQIKEQSKLLKNQANLLAI